MKDKILEVCQEYSIVQKKMEELEIEDISINESWRYDSIQTIQVRLDVKTFNKLFPDNKGRTYYSSNRRDYEEKYKDVKFTATNGKSRASFKPM